MSTQQLLLKKLLPLFVLFYDNRRRNWFPFVFMSLLTLCTEQHLCVCPLSESIAALLLHYLNTEVFIRQIQTDHHSHRINFMVLLFRYSKNCKQSGRFLTSTQVSISLCLFMMGSMVSMLLCSTRSDLFPTRIRGTLDTPTAHTDSVVSLLIRT